MEKINVELLLFGMMIMSLSSFAQNRNHFEIRGKLTGLKDGTHLVLIRNNKNDGVDTVGSSFSKNETFFFKGRVPVEAEPYFIKIDTTGYNGRIKKRLITILLDNSRIKLNGTIDDLSVSKIRVEGSVSHSDYVNYRRIEDSLLQISNAWLDSLNRANRNHLKDFYNRYQVKYVQAHENFNVVMTEWILNHSNSLLTPWVIDLIYKGDLHKISKYYQGLSLKSKNSKFGIDLKNQLDALERTALGKDAPGFEFPDQDGNLCSLKSVASKSKVMLLDFWASWCGPCLDKIPEMKKLYDEFHSRGLNILSYSVDEKESSWKKSISRNNISWYNVRETAKSFAENLYGVTELPETFLIDNKGKIIAKGLWGEELRKKIEELLGNGR